MHPSHQARREEGTGGVTALGPGVEDVMTFFFWSAHELGRKIGLGPEFSLGAPASHQPFSTILWMNKIFSYF